MTNIKYGFVALLAGLTGQIAVAATPIDFITHNQIEVNAPASAIWPFVMQMERWKKGASLVPIDGAPNRLGSKFKMLQEGGNVGWTFENVELVPQQIRTLRMNGPDGTLIGYATLRLIPHGRSTLVRYDVLAVFPATPDLAKPDDRARILAESSKRFDEELATLKELSEGGRRRHFPNASPTMEADHP
ncbi:SRPBCC family protein [Sphingosinicella rhizophila]|uniref:SRPBCC family protein n=1 Tax=Sphingosinicella rhizophila TaxID=3050082 RepID=A0ABU3Q1T9_9SPHN|nr:hypothetical protein [Sphingosinicella sp. GR2756]MDT9597382.1 hypothetical protein [Sphingosinicella sp. GR2756]